MTKPKPKAPIGKQPEQHAATKQPAGWLMAIIILALTFFTCFPILSEDKQFTNWDDVGYVTEQPLIKSLDADNIKKIFSPSSVVLFNYHPLTILSLAIDYARGYDEDTASISIAPFASTNLLLHLANTLLVFLLAYRLATRQVWVAAIAAALFGIHPMHIESVAWISARKDLLYCMFFLLSIISYLKYTDDKKTGFLALSFMFFVASCLSKAMAIPLPFVLLLTDYLIKRKFSARVWVEKIPFIAVSVIIGLFAVHAQQGAMIGKEFGMGDRFLLAGYGYVMYIVRFFLPLGLSAIYPYPDHDVIPAYYYLTLLLAIAIVSTPIVLTIRRHKEAGRLLWSIGFYSLMIAMVLQFVTLGNSAMNDRYTYVSYIGLSIGLALYIGKAIAHNKYKIITAVATSVFIIALSATAHNRISVWENSEALWRDAVNKYPVEKSGYLNLNAKAAYKNLADHYASNQQFDSAFTYYKILTDRNLNDAEVWSNMGNIYVLRNDLINALSSFNVAVRLDPENYESWFKRGLVNGFMHRYAEGVRDMDQALQLNPGYKEAIALRARFSSNLTQQK